MQSVATTKNISHQRSFFQLTGDLEVDPTTHNFFLSFADHRVPLQNGSERCENEC